jgi:hypothetical protein
MREHSVDFELEDGYRDRQGLCHRRGRMRPSTAGDEIRVLGDFRVHLRPQAFLTVILSRVIIELGTLPGVHVGIVERLSSADLSRLERLYRELNHY